jgi:hypothetical protein
VKLIDRVKLLERLTDAGELLTMQVTGAPTAEQAALIERCARTGRRLAVFYMPDDSLWMPGCGVPPWEVEHGNA